MLLCDSVQLTTILYFLRTIPILLVYVHVLFMITVPSLYTYLLSYRHAIRLSEQILYFIRIYSSFQLSYMLFILVVFLRC
jgi:hypothetical protein